MTGLSGSMSIADESRIQNVPFSHLVRMARENSNKSKNSQVDSKSLSHQSSKKENQQKMNFNEPTRNEKVEIINNESSSDDEDDDDFWLALKSQMVQNVENNLDDQLSQKLPPKTETCDMHAFNVVREPLSKEEKSPEYF